MDNSKSIPAINQENDRKIPVKNFSERNCFYTSETRSRNMAKILSKNTKPEMRIRRALWKKRIRFRLHDKNLPGTPDIVIKKYRLAIFVDGEFWHGKNWETNKSKIKTNLDYWIPKIERNIQNDMNVNRKLCDMGFTVFRFWSKDVMKHCEKCVNQVLLYLECAKETRIPRSE